MTDLPIVRQVNRPSSVNVRFGKGYIPRLIEDTLLLIRYAQPEYEDVIILVARVRGAHRSPLLKIVEACFNKQIFSPHRLEA